ncbi:MAG TPA: hypothetical protein VER98_03980 [Terriglobia bacterium]|nr:hypothetical protein [Terriglobia bacterium]
MSELAEVFQGSSIIGTGGFFGGFKISKMDLFAFNGNLGLPVDLLEVIYAFIASCIITLLSTIAAILRMTARSEIVTSIIKTVAVVVVSINGLMINQNAMHVNELAIGATPNRIETSFVFQCAPVPLHQPIVIGSIYDGVVAFGQRDKFDRLVLRLDDFVSRHTIFLHDLTSNKILRRSAAFAFYTI